MSTDRQYPSVRHSLHNFHLHNCFGFSVAYFVIWRGPRAVGERSEVRVCVGGREQGWGGRQKAAASFRRGSTLVHMHVWRHAIWVEAFWIAEREMRWEIKVAFPFGTSLWLRSKPVWTHPVFLQLVTWDFLFLCCFLFLACFLAQWLHSRGGWSIEAGEAVPPLLRGKREIKMRKGQRLKLINHHKISVSYSLFGFHHLNFD